MWTGGRMMAFFWVMFGIAVFFVTVRLYVNYRGLRGKTYLKVFRDVLVVASLIFFLGGTVIIQFLVSNDYFNIDGTYFSSRTAEFQATAYKLVLVQAFLYLPGVFFCKFDLLLLYHDLAPRAHHPRIFIMIVLCWFFSIIGLLVQILALFLTCRPFNLNWAVPYNSCVVTTSYFATIWTFHIFSDLLIYIVPILIIRKLQKVTLAKKIQASAMFGLGFINVAGAFIMMSGLMVQNTSWALYGASMFMAPVQQATALWIVCMPHLRTFFGVIKPKQAAVVQAEAPSSPPLDSEGPSRGSSEIKEVNTAEERQKSASWPKKISSAARRWGDSLLVPTVNDSVFDALERAERGDVHDIAVIASPEDMDKVDSRETA